MKPTTKTRLNNLGLLTIRVILATVFVYHGGQKLFGLFGGYGIEGTAKWMASAGIPFPTLSVVLAGSAEFFGGLALLTGLAARLATVPMVFTMVVAIATTHLTGFDARTGGMEYPLTLAAVLAGIGLTGPGRFTLVELVRQIRTSREPAVPAAT